MRRLQAAMRDQAAKSWKERIVMYKVGSPMKGCRFCGDIEEDEDTGKRRYLSGFQVFRAYRPWETKWTWKCWECGSTDLACWEPDSLGLVENELGKEPILGARDAVRSRKYELRKAAMSDMKKPAPKLTGKEETIAQLEAELERLKMVLKASKS